LDARQCRLLQAFLEERPPARQFVADLADRAATKIRKSRGARVTPAILSLPAP